MGEFKECLVWLPRREFLRSVGSFDELITTIRAEIKLSLRNIQIFIHDPPIDCEKQLSKAGQ